MALTKRQQRMLRWLLVPVMLYLSGGLIIAIGRLPLKAATDALLLSAAGFAVGLILFSSVSPLIRVYVVGHELTHWLMAKLFRRRTAGLELGSASGSIQVDRPNVWIVLAPYFLPIYALLWLVVYGLAAIFLHDRWWSAPTLFAGLGFTYAFHVVLTGLTLLAQQTDLQYYGRIFSLALVALVNVAILFISLAYLSGNLGSSASYAWEAYIWQSQCLARIITGVGD